MPVSAPVVIQSVCCTPLQLHWLQHLQTPRHQQPRAGCSMTENALSPGRAPMPRPTAFTYASLSVHSRTKCCARCGPSVQPAGRTQSPIIDFVQVKNSSSHR